VLGRPEKRGARDASFSAIGWPLLAARVCIARARRASIKPGHANDVATAITRDRPIDRWRADS
jgi:hypothetical protein